MGGGGGGGGVGGGGNSAMVTHSPPTSEVCGSNPGAYVGKLPMLVVACRWLPLYSTKP